MVPSGLSTVLILIFLLTSCASQSSFEKEEKQNKREVSDMEMTSSVFVDGGLIPLKYTCDGDDVVPPLLFSDVPAGTKSFALVVDDPDTPRGTWDHWVLWNIAPDARAINEGEAPPALYGMNSARQLTWHGPCPPDREHRYFFRLYALDNLLSLPEG